MISDPKTWEEYNTLSITERQEYLNRILETQMKDSDRIESDYLSGDYARADSRFSYELGE